MKNHDHPDRDLTCVPLLSESGQPQETDFVVDPAEQGCRLDVFLAQRLPQHSRTHLRRAIDAGAVLVDAVRAKVAYKLLSGQRVTVSVPELPRESPVPENIPLDILYEDECLAAINKPPGMVVHPAKGHWSGTLTSALAYHFTSLSRVGGATRPGIVHRLDRDTSGVIVVAKTDEAHSNLAAQFEARTVVKEYLAICRGVSDRDHDLIDEPIGTHVHHRQKMAIRAGHGTSRQARTEYTVHQRFRGFSWIRAFPKSGRTHQIRVHLAHIGCPVVCDKLYAGHAQITRHDLDRTLRDDTPIITRQALHALSLRIEHPETGQPLTFRAPIPDDIQSLIEALSQHR